MYLCGPRPYVDGAREMHHPPQLEPLAIPYELAEEEGRPIPHQSVLESDHQWQGRQRQIRAPIPMETQPGRKADLKREFLKEDPALYHHLTECVTPRRL